MKYTSRNPNGINQITGSAVAITVLNNDVAVFTTSSLTLSGSLTASSALITGNVTVLGTASINTLIVNQTQLSTGSNQLGDAANDTQTLYGTVVIPTGSLTVTGSVNILTGGGYLSLKALGGGSTQIEGSSTLGLNPIGALDFYRNGVLHSRIANSTSNWLIGTTTDSGFKLDVNGTGRFSGNVQITGSATNSLLVKGSGTTSTTTAFRVENANASGSMVVLNDGFVGIGTTTPSTKLHVSGAVGDGIILNGLGSVSMLIQAGGLTGGSGTVQLFAGNNNNSYLRLASEYIREGAGGGLGVNVSRENITAKFQVKGSGTTSATTSQ
jgi:hypothetical protein